MGCLYKLTSPSGKSYIGISMFPIEKRLLEHQRNATKRNGRGPLRSAIRKYGIASFTCQVLAERDSWAELCELERTAIETHGTFCPRGYNMTTGGDGVVGLAEESKQLHRSQTSVGTLKAWQRPSMRAKRAAAFEKPAVKTKQAETTRKQMATAYQDPAFVEKIRAARANPEFRKAMSRSVRELWKNPEYRANQVAKRRGRSHRTEESRRAQSEKMRALIAARKAAGTYWR
jgi:group I intron endonuclease